MQIISKIFLIIFGVKITNFNIHCQIRAFKKIVILTPKMVKNIFEIICILTAAKNYTSNFSETPLGPFIW